MDDDRLGASLIKVTRSEGIEGLQDVAWLRIGIGGDVPAGRAKRRARSGLAVKLDVTPVHKELDPARKHLCRLPANSASGTIHGKPYRNAASPSRDRVRDRATLALPSERPDQRTLLPPTDRPADGDNR